MRVKGDHLMDKDATWEVVQRDGIGMEKIGLAKEGSSQKNIMDPRQPLQRSKLFWLCTSNNTYSAFRYNYEYCNVEHSWLIYMLVLFYNLTIYFLIYFNVFHSVNNNCINFAIFWHKNIPLDILINQKLSLVSFRFKKWTIDEKTHR